MTSYVDTFLGGTTTLSLASSTPINLTQAQCRNAMLRITGTLLASIVVQPDTGVLLTGFVYWENVTSGSFTVTFTNAGGSVVLPQNRRGIMWVDTTYGPRIVAIAGSTNADPIPTGTVMLFYQNAAPSGWTISSSLNDYALKIVSSSGGVTSGSVLYSTLFGRTATDSHTLTVAEIPSHTHPISPAYPQFSGSVATGAGNNGVTTGGSATQATGGGGGHTHDIDMRVLTASVILATKAA
jgi:hypothetical protein